MISTEETELLKDESKTSRFNIESEPAVIETNDNKVMQNGIVNYFVRLKKALGLKYILFVFAVYGINQGIGETVSGTAVEFFFSDPRPKGLNLSEIRSQKILAFAFVPWQAKSVYGIISDLYPIHGLKRVPYVFFAGLVGTLSGSCLSIFGSSLSIPMVGVLLFFSSFSMASPDVMVDASLAENCRKLPVLASDMQTLCWGSFAVGAILSSFLSGFIYDEFSSSGLFLFFSLTGVALLLPSSQNWLGDIDVRYQSTQESFEFDPKSENSANMHLIKKNQNLVVKLSLCFLFISVVLGVLAELDMGVSLLVFVASLATLATTWIIFYFETSISRNLAKASAYIFLSGALQPSSVILSYWLRDIYPYCKDPLRPDYHKTPCFSAPFLTNLGVLGNICLLLGTILYNRTFSKFSYRKIYFITQVMLIGCGFLDLVLVSRINLSLGIPDEWFVIGDEIIVDVIERLNTMPVFILAASLCPPGIEATLFAFNMGISNFGRDIGSFFGLGLLDWLNLSRENDFNNLQLYLIIRNASRIIPLLLIPFLVPKGSPMKSLLETSEEGEVHKPVEPKHQI